MQPLWGDPAAELERAMGNSSRHKKPRSGETPLARYRLAGTPAGGGARSAPGFPAG